MLPRLRSSRSFFTRLRPSSLSSTLAIYNLDPSISSVITKRPAILARFMIRNTGRCSPMFVPTKSHTQKRHRISRVSLSSSLFRARTKDYHLIAHAQKPLGATSATFAFVSSLEWQKPRFMPTIRREPNRISFFRSIAEHGYV